MYQDCKHRWETEAVAGLDETCKDEKKQKHNNLAMKQLWGSLTNCNNVIEVKVCHQFPFIVGEYPLWQQNTQCMLNTAQLITQKDPTGKILTYDYLDHMIPGKDRLTANTITLLNAEFEAGFFESSAGMAGGIDARLFRRSILQYFTTTVKNITAWRHRSHSTVLDVMTYELINICPNQRSPIFDFNTNADKKHNY